MILFSYRQDDDEDDSDDEVDDFDEVIPKRIGNKNKRFGKMGTKAALVIFLFLVTELRVASAVVVVQVGSLVQGNTEDCCYAVRRTFP